SRPALADSGPAPHPSQRCPCTVPATTSCLMSSCSVRSPKAYLSAAADALVRPNGLSGVHPAARLGSYGAKNGTPSRVTRHTTGPNVEEPARLSTTASLASV